MRYANTVALTGISLRLAPREVVGLIGPSGAGKTTLLGLLNGTVQASEGQVTVDGAVVASLRPHALRNLRASIGVIPQQFDLVPALNAAQNVLLGQLGRQGWWGGVRALVAPRRADLEAVHALLGRLGIGDKLFHPTDSLSGGEQQRVAIARALFQEPRALLADEPVASVDPVRAREVLDLLRVVAEQAGATLVISLHDLALARTLPRLIGLRNGTVAFDGAPDQLDDPAAEALYRPSA